MVSITPSSSASTSLPRTKAMSQKAVQGISSSPRATPPTPMQSILKKSKPTMMNSPATSNMGAAAGQKRKHDDLELSSASSGDSAAGSGSGSSPPSSSVGSDESADRKKKKARVTFEPEVEVRLLRDERRKGGDGDGEKKVKAKGEKSTAVVREEVRRAIQRHVSGSESDAYERVKEVFLADPKRKAGEDDDDEMDLGRQLELPTHESLRNHLMGLLSNVSALDRRCNELVNAVVGSEWLGRDESYVKLFVRFLGNLTAAQGGYLGPVLKMLVNGLADVPREVGKLPGYAVVHTSEIYARTHMAIRHILRLVPAASGSLVPILSTNFPFGSDPVKANVAYTRNLIRMMDYAPELQSDILALIMERLVKIDVQIQIDMDDFEDEVGEDIIEDVTGPEYAGFVDEDKEDDEDDDDSVASDDDMDAEAMRVKAVRDNIRKLDCMIDIMFEYYNPAFTSGTLNDQANAFDLLLNHFTSIILPTYRSRHPQFLLFHFTQTSPILIDRFATTCVNKLLDPRQAAVTRQSVAAYLASFVARGAHVSSGVVQDVFYLLGTHIANLRLDYEDTCRGPDLRSYSTFYSTAQAILYIFCFRWRDLTTTAHDEDGHNDNTNGNNHSNNNYHDLDLDDITFPSQVKEILHQTIYSKLNPLKICSPPIVSEFARIAHHLRILYVYPLLETNKRIRVSNNPSFRRNITASSSYSDTRFSQGQAERETRAGGDGGNQLDAYFPFDPYHLPRSLRWLDGDYVEWKGIPGLDGRGGGNEDDDDDDTDDSDGAGAGEDEEEGDEVSDSDGSE